VERQKDPRHHSPDVCFQSIAEVSNTHSAGEAQTIVENCGNTLILRCSGSEHGGTSRFASNLIGEREIVRAEYSRRSSPQHSPEENPPIDSLHLKGITLDEYGAHRT
jgi:predicted RNA-binding Zn-ribbon protein involved in translation (DUF1610 family)